MGRSADVGLLGVLKMRVQRVVQEAGPRYDVGIVPADLREALADRPEAVCFRLLAGLFGEVGVVDDPGESAEGRVVAEALLHELLERAPSPSILVRVPGPRRVEAHGTFASLDLGDLLRLHESDLAFRVQEPADEPRGCRAVHVDVPSRHPPHQVNIVNAITSVNCSIQYDESRPLTASPHRKRRIRPGTDREDQLGPGAPAASSLKRKALRPTSLARYMAVSAFRRRVAACRPFCGK